MSDVDRSRVLSMARASILSDWILTSPFSARCVQAALSSFRMFCLAMTGLIANLIVKGYLRQTRFIEMHAFPQGFPRLQTFPKKVWLVEADEGLRLVVRDS